MVTNEVIAATLDTESVPEVAARKLLSQANDGGARDNITVGALIRYFGGAPLSTFDDSSTWRCW